DGDGNAGTESDPQWTPLLPTPPFPDYVCGHSTVGAAGQAALESLFGRRPGLAMTMVSTATPGVVHTFSTFAAVENEVINARVWAGIHWRTSCTAGRGVGLRVGRWTASH